VSQAHRIGEAAIPRVAGIGFIAHRRSRKSSAIEGRAAVTRTQRRPTSWRLQRTYNRTIKTSGRSIFLKAAGASLLSIIIDRFRGSSAQSVCAFFASKRSFS
jgi:hypothetical protein